MKIPLPVVNRMQNAAASAPFFTSAIPRILAVSRGGVSSAATDALAIDMTRVGMRLSAMSSYAVISSLLLGSGLYIFSMTPVKTIDSMSKMEQRAVAAFTILVSINIAASLHTAVIFSVMTLYANTALGQGLDQAFLQFWNAPHTQGLRRSAFHSFLVAITAHQASFALSVFLKSNGRHRWIATIAAVLIMILTGSQLTLMVLLASKTRKHKHLSYPVQCRIINL